MGSIAATIALCRSMSDGMAMPGGWTMSMAWMRMPGQNWLGAAAMFMLMWIVMMVAMMLPSLAPILRHRSSNRWRVAMGYFFVWTIFGAAVYVVGIVVTTAAMRSQELSRSVPVLAGVVLVLAGLVQIAPWKVHHLACCRVLSESRSAWRDGIRFGVHCVACCSGLIAILLVLGVMNLAVMAAVGAAITIERLAPHPDRVARVIGLMILAAGAMVTFR